MRTFTTQPITDVDIEQIVITRSTDDEGNLVIRVRSSASVQLVDMSAPTKSTTMNLNLNTTIQELGVGQAVNTIRTAILTALRNQIT